MAFLCHLVLMAAAAAEPAAEQRLGDAVCRLQLDHAEVALSGELSLTLSIEGPAPVEVEPPRRLTKSPNWRVSAGPPKTTLVANGRQRWEQTFRLEPFQDGPRVALSLEPVRFRTGNEIRDWLLVWETRTINVTTSVPEADLGRARGVTGIEELPPVPGSSMQPWIIALATLAAGCLVLGALLLLRSRRVAEPRLSPLAQALADLHHLESAGIKPEDMPRIADIVRAFLEARFQLQATRQTTAEFIASLRQAQVLGSEQVACADDLLRRCDLVKFAGERPTEAECTSLVDAARRTIAESSASAQSAENASSLPVK